MADDFVYLTPKQSWFLKGLAIFCILSHNFFHLFPPITFQNEMAFEAQNFARFLQDFSWKNVLNCFFSFFGFYGVYIFIFLSGYGLTKSFVAKKQNPLFFVGRHCLKIYLLLLLSVGLYLCFSPQRSWSGLFYVLTLTANFAPGTLFSACGPWWFFALIIQLYLLFWFCYKFIDYDILLFISAFNQFNIHWVLSSLSLESVFECLIIPFI